ncbi:MBL fold metallo-hydrolase [Caulobacter vibrioides]|uniref:Zn-dependent hydrolase, glyoxalase II family n=1 Tax=Caulobacter vibrioides (strain NA1000 / CB15N) TaxID=565050 RepID=A0A0H3CAE6_CAUVN|nr:MBL fold metallo-hydrolase [Caulobacter vibrioides]YP_002518332.1 MBL fold metallo-hydrolase [Caulobacter vibrioides NA1000]ACL96424.1 MBL fold metallo-hydrolase [Caulobacter vibrioides NA1000]ATC29698.1 MBL fold metallo-hydrolase [Caulobacter vibrioides]QXZ51218.1 MBL fold metallo-hydrolase [Caulobacter vibrioides]
MRPDVQAFFDTATFTASYLVVDPATKTAAIIDPVLDFEPKAGKLSTTSADALLAAVRDQGLHLAYVLETHAHADHLSAADLIRRKTGAKIVIGAKITEVQKTFIPVFESDARPDGAVFDVLMEEGDALPLGELSIAALHTPGHTPACMTYRIGDAAFVGDTLFMPDYGTARADFPGGDARTLYRSIQKVLALPDETRIFVGHDYLPAGRDTFHWETTVAEERARNIHVGGGAQEDDFVAMRQARDATLAAPTLILPSLQVNIRAGALPDPTAAGNVFLRLPVTWAA